MLSDLLGKCYGFSLGFAPCVAFLPSFQARITNQASCSRPVNPAALAAKGMRQFSRIFFLSLESVHSPLLVASALICTSRLKPL